MKDQINYQKIPRSRIATFDVYSVGLSRHHISALLEFDVTDSRQRLREMKRMSERVSFTAWLIKAISRAIELHPEVAGYIQGKKRLVTFRDVNITVIVEKEVEGKKVPLPLLIEKTNEKSIPAITGEIADALAQESDKNDIVLQQRSRFYEGLYYRLPGTLRRAVWRFFLRHPRLAHKKMGNVVITSLNMIGRINGWFIHRSVHPVSFGISSVIKKPVVLNEEIVKREILNMTVLVDHDVVDGAPMVRFLHDLTRQIEGEAGLLSEAPADNEINKL